MIGITLALVAAASWGAGDFLGGLASRKLNQFQVLLLTTYSSLILLFLFAVISGEHFPSANNILIAIVAGVSGSIGLSALYKGLSLGKAALVAPVAGVIGAIIPILVGIFIEGLPGILKLIGFVVSIAGIWLITRSEDGNGSIFQAGLGLAILAGIGFGGFFVFIAQIEGEQVFAPLVFTKLTSLIFAIILIRARQLSIPKPAASPIAIWSGFLDVGGSIFYLFATHFTRLDIAAILSSFYPAVTVLLSSIILKEKISSYQWVGVSLCIVAITLITSG
jgi:drug/metabolite transporter (DMT)-like permease